MRRIVVTLGLAAVIWGSHAAAVRADLAFYQLNPVGGSEFTLASQSTRTRSPGKRNDFHYWAVGDGHQGSGNRPAQRHVLCIHRATQRHTRGSGRDQPDHGDRCDHQQRQHRDQLRRLYGVRFLGQPLHG